MVIVFFDECDGEPVSVAGTAPGDLQGTPRCRTGRSKVPGQRTAWRARLGLGNRVMPMEPLTAEDQLTLRDNVRLQDIGAPALLDGRCLLERGGRFRILRAALESKGLSFPDGRAR
jgi:hypothetical protein